jgi:hypothetical protein
MPFEEKKRRQRKEDKKKGQDVQTNHVILRQPAARILQSVKEMKFEFTCNLLKPSLAARLNDITVHF